MIGEVFALARITSEASFRLLVNTWCASMKLKSLLGALSGLDEGISLKLTGFGLFDMVSSVEEDEIKNH